MPVVWWTIAIWLAVTAYIERDSEDPIYQLFTALVIIIATEAARIRRKIREEARHGR